MTGCRKFVYDMGTKVIAVLIAVGLAIGVWWLWPRGESADPVATTVLAAEPTTTATDVFTSTTPTSTTLAHSESHVVETVEEAEEILRELWFGWFEGIYNQDEDRIREVVATEESVEEALSQFGQVEFDRPPEADDITFGSTELLRTDEDCLAVWTEMALRGFREGDSVNVHILRWHDERWMSLSVWKHREDLWEAECDSLLPESS